MSGPQKHHQAKLYTDEQLRRLTTSAASKQWQRPATYSRANTNIITPQHNLTQSIVRLDAQSSDPQLNMRLQHFRQQSSLNIEPLDHLTGEILPISMSAPMSMANLAQLSGVSLIPVVTNNNNNNANPCQQQFDTTGGIQRQQSKDSLKPYRQASQQQPPQYLGNNLTAPKNITVTNQTISSSAQQPNIYNLTTIPSIQLISQQISADQRNDSCWEDNVYNSLRARSSKKSSSNKKARNNLTNINLHSHRELSSAYQTIASAAAPKPNVVNCAQLISNLDNPGGIVPALNNFHHQETQDDIEPSDVSLMRIMAILNNPAMTITPVGSMQSALNRITDSTPASNNNLANGAVNHERILDQPRHTSNNIQACQARTKPTSSGKNVAARLPKSAANLLAANSAAQVQRDVKQELSIRPTNITVGIEPPKLDNSPLDWLSSLSKPKGDDNSVTLSWLPNTSKTVQKVSLDDQQQVPESSTAEDQVQRSSQTISVQMLHQLANQAEDSTSLQSCNDSLLDKTLTIEPECAPITPRFTVKQLDKGARGQEIEYSVTVDEDAVLKLKTKQPLKSSKRQLYIPDQDVARKRPRKTLDNLPQIHIDAIEQREVLISERHLMLERMVEIAETVGQRTHAPIEPDDIFVNRSKRIMSRIDTILERKKRKRFELICDRSSPRNEVDVESDDDDDDDDSESLIDESTKLFDSIVVPIQLPLEEPLTDEKREYLSKVGLISRSDRNNLSIEQCERRLKSISALALEELDEVPEDIQRFVKTVSQTGGTDIQLRTETCIKRSELPFIEGLNRNTSRIKMNFMAALGLDKRSKRTTLYKVAKPQETTQMTNNLKQRNDLMEKQQHYQQKARKIINNDTVEGNAQMMMQTSRQDKQNGNNNQLRIEAAHLIAKAVEFAQANCRKALQVPKDEYMKSLGLMAS